MVVVGAGLAGLSAAHVLAAHEGVDVLVLESADVPGGVAQTQYHDHDVMEWGPEAVAATPEVVALMDQLGLEAVPPRPSSGGTMLSLGGKLRPLPLQLATGSVPDLSDVFALVRNGVLPPGSLLRMAAEPLAAMRRRAPGTLARTYGDLIGYRAMRRLIAPFAVGVLGSPAEVLADDVVPRPAVRSLAIAVARQGFRRHVPTRTKGSGLVAVAGGMHRLVTALAASARVQLRTPVRSVLANADGTFDVRSAEATFVADAVVLAVPAPVAGRILAEISPSAAQLLEGVATSSSAVLHVDVVPEQQDRLATFCAPGWLAAPEEGAAVAAGSFVGTKWPHIQRPGRVRATVRRADLLAASDEHLLRVALDDIERVLGLATVRREARVHRWTGVLPVRGPGTSQRVAGAGELLPRGIELAGTAEATVGVAAVLASGRRAADRIVA